MGTSALGPRVLLRRLREVMAEPVTAQKRLDKIVQIIAANMVAEVCSIYVMRPGDFVELYATEGLKREAVHKSKLKSGEGLVGTIAKQAIGLNLSDAQQHPSFKYLPETGEEIYHSFLGVPIMRGGAVIGVLVVQNRTRRHYTEEEEEALQTTAMVLAEVIAAGELREVASEVAADVAHVRSHHLRGDSLAEGVALGHAVLHEPRVIIENLIAENVPAEKRRLEDAVAQLRAHVDELLDGSDAQRGAPEYSDVLETIRMFAHDKGWMNRLREAIDTGLTAEAAVERVQNDNRARMMRTPDPYLRERMHDLDELSNRLLRILTGAIATASRTDLPQTAIVVALPCTSAIGCFAGLNSIWPPTGPECLNHVAFMLGTRSRFTGIGSFSWMPSSCSHTASSTGWPTLASSAGPCSPAGPRPAEPFGWNRTSGGTEPMAMGQLSS